MRKVCVVVGSRANYSSIKSVMRAVEAHDELELQLIVGASALLDRFGSVVDVIEADGFKVDFRMNMIIEGETPVTMAQSAGLGLMQLPTIFEQIKPDVVVSVGDRFETMATAVAAAYMNITLAHTMGGEVSGSIDESIRHAITKLAHIHFPASKQAADRVIALGEDPKTVHLVGCPRNDLAAEVVRTDGHLQDQDWLQQEGVGGYISPDEPFLLVSQHPVTTEYGQGEEQITETLTAIQQLEMPTVMLWPNVDAGSEDVARGMRIFRERHQHDHIRFFKNFPVETFIQLMVRCACMVGNSSAAIREGAFLGVPAINVGTRQAGRERGSNVVDVECDRDSIFEAVHRQLRHGRYPPEHIYGDGHAGERIAAILATCPLHVQKRISF